jgi:hypothetical protein
LRRWWRGISSNKYCLHWFNFQRQSMAKSRAKARPKTLSSLSTIEDLRDLVYCSREDIENHSTTTRRTPNGKTIQDCSKHLQNFFKDMGRNYHTLPAPLSFFRSFWSDSIRKVTGCGNIPKHKLCSRNLGHTFFTIRTIMLNKPDGLIDVIEWKEWVTLAFSRLFDSRFSSVVGLMISAKTWPIYIDICLQYFLPLQINDKKNGHDVLRSFTFILIWEYEILLCLMPESVIHTAFSLSSDAIWTWARKLAVRTMSKGRETESRGPSGHSRRMLFGQNR